MENNFKEILSNRLQKVEILKKIDEIKFTRIKEQQAKLKLDLDIEKARVEIEQLKCKENSWSHPIDKLISVAHAWCIDNDKTIIGSEPAIVSLWNEDQLDYIRKKIFEKIDSL